MKLKFPELAAIFLFILPTFPTYACSPVKAYPIFFDTNSSKISIVQFQKLAEWTHWLNKRYVNRQLIETEVQGETEEDDGIQLGWQRELAVRLALIDLDFTAPTFNPTEKIWIGPPRPIGTAGGIPSRSVWITFLPGCPHECACQDN